jgi:hypothetical protein
LAEFLAIHQSDAALLGCVLRRVAGKVSLGISERAAGVGFFQSDDVLLRKRPLGGQPVLPEKLAEGEKLLYWLEVTDDDTVSGPKKSASATQAVKIYSEAEHRRQVLEKANLIRIEYGRIRILDLEGLRTFT